MRDWNVILPVFLIALAVNMGIGFKLGISRPMTSDAEYFLDIAGNVAEGRGYVLDHGFWPGQPTASRMPGWPLFVSPFLRLFHGADPNVVMRLVCLGVNAAAAGLLAMLAGRMAGRGAALAAGLLYAVHPTALFAACEGMSEPLFIALTAAGFLLVCGPCQWKRMLGVLLLGLTCLVRAQFILWIVFVLPAAGAYMLLKRTLRPRTAAIAAAGVLLFLLPTAIWAVRNQRISGQFPVISTIRGQTFYGGNNPVVADTLEWWGYWVFPDGIPGETPMRELASTMSELQVDRHYNERGAAYIRSHVTEMPRLWLGKIVRAYVPVPWKFSMGTLAVSGYRWLLYLGFAAGIVIARRRTAPVYWLLFGGLWLSTFASVVVFWGCARFAFAAEPFMTLPFAALIGAMRLGRFPAGLSQ